ncbi:hypothetical protein [Hyphomicrobium sp. CS1GBMeth3]|uniref:hypothetical protein n=1 Tax=Hyphomicrobium sp. CS1GBMeth3 TaxID=1892845 RepID=UPI000930AB6C|nr:hypothetical protein [Hyphomicrobium sp. CS1GBMeth3]
MSKKQISEIEDYLLGRIAWLEETIQAYAGSKDDLPSWRSALAEARRTLKKVREIVKGEKAR